MAVSVENFHPSPNSQIQLLPPTGFSFSALQSNQVNIATESVGTSGIIVDNNASATTSPQAASVYFNALQENTACTNNTNGAETGGCAVKLTQLGLN